MILDISHKTEYHFSTAPQYGLQQIRLTPQSHSGQRVESWDVSFEGAALEAVFTDYHQNTVHLISLDKGTTQLSVTSKGKVEIKNKNGIVGRHFGFAPLWLYLQQTPLTLVGKGVRTLSKHMMPSQDTDLNILHALSSRIAEQIIYKTGQTNAMTSAEDAIQAGAGVCQDHSHVFIAAARYAGYPARYVSGYLMMNDRVAQEATHAWAEVFIPDLGWTGFDVSNQISPDERYVRVATGLDYSCAAPISGLTIGGQDESISVNVQVQQ